MASTPRLILLIILVPVVLLVVAGLLLSLLLDKDKVLELAAGTLYEQTGATLTVAGDSNLSLFPTLGVTLGDAGLTMPGEARPSLKVDSLEIGVQLLPLLSGRAEIDSIALAGVTLKVESSAQAPAINTSGMSDAELDAFYAERRDASQNAGKAAGAEAALAVPLALNVRRLTVTDSRIEQVDSATQKTTVIELARLEASGLNLDANPIALDAQVTLAGETPLELALGGSLRVDQKNQSVILDSIEMVISGATQEPVNLQILGEVDISRQVADLTLNLATGGTRGEGTLRYARFESPQIDTRLQLNRLDPALLALAGPDAAAQPAVETARPGGDDPLPLDAIRAIDTRAFIAIDNAVFGAHTINNLQTSLRVVDGVIAVNSLSGELHRGQLELQATFNAKHNMATLDTVGQLGSMDIAAALAATTAKPTLSGEATLDWKLASRGRTRAELVAALTGPIKLATRQVVLNEINVEQMLCQAVALTNQESLTASFGTNTGFESLSADIQLADGKASLRPLRAELAHLSLLGNGNYDLLSQDFKVTLKATLSPELETLDRACRVSKRLTAIDWPVRCKGNLSGEASSWCRVDTAEIIEDLGKGEAKRKLQKEAGKLLDKLFK